MKIGTKSVLFGAHTFWLHPWFVAWGWWKLYGFPWDPRLWVAFFVHDLGYFGKPNMDGPEGERHPEWGAKVMHFLFDRVRSRSGGRFWWEWRWHDFVMYHSRYLAKKDGHHFSRLCVADKLAIALTPAWLYLPMVELTGELDEYMGKMAEHHADMVGKVDNSRAEVWYAGVQEYCRNWALNHRDGREDTWTNRRAPGSPKHPV